MSHRSYRHTTALYAFSLLSGFQANAGQAFNDSGDTPAVALERRLHQMESAFRQMEAERRAMASEMEAMRAEMKRINAEAKAVTPDTQRRSLDNTQASLKKQDSPGKYEKKHMVFFRGGYPDMVNSRSNQAYTDLYAKDNGYRPQNKERDGVYFGAGVDLNISDDLFGLLGDTQFMTEIMFNWNRWDSHQGGFTAVGNNGAQNIVPVMAKKLGLNPQDRHLRGVTLSQFTLSASPKIKFMHGSDFRPWIIPVGMSFSFISPSSDSGTNVGPGVMFGTGFDYNFWDDLFVGMDGRYNWVANEMDGVKASYYQVGGYIGAGF
ncbi:MAG: hypothetical protein ACK443_05430 [Methylococcaceae bacterium]|jgi:hypothetical protein